MQCRLTQCLFTIYKIDAMEVGEFMCLHWYTGAIHMIMWHKNIQAQMLITHLFRDILCII